MLYEQKIKYMEYREAGAKIKGAGFVKLERWGEAWNVLLQISGLPAGCTGEKGVYLCGGRKEVLVGLISMEQGRGRLELQEDDTRDPAEDGIRFAEAERIRIPIGPEKEVVGILREMSAAGNAESREKLFAGEDEKKVFAEESSGNLLGTGIREDAAETRRDPVTEEPQESPALEIQEGSVEAKEQERLSWEEQGNIAGMEPGKQRLKNGEQSSAGGQKNNTGMEPGEGLAGESGQTILQRMENGEQSSAGGQKNNTGMEPGEGLARESGQTIPRKLENGEQSFVGEPRNNTGMEPGDGFAGEQGQTIEREDFRDRLGSDGQKLNAQSLETPGREDPQPYVFQAALQPDKWEQLRSIYPSVRPFGDDREYLRISPGDFVILKDRSYRLANNSFLLHGYFNYKHLILHRASRQGETLYFVGVPGNFYDKEKEVAILFGFESFECAREPAKEGDYGYYMMRVEL